MALGAFSPLSVAAAFIPRLFWRRFLRSTFFGAPFFLARLTVTKAHLIPRVFYHAHLLKTSVNFLRYGHYLSYFGQLATRLGRGAGQAQGLINGRRNRSPFLIAYFIDPDSMCHLTTFDD
jgi:hypothetical protein